MCGEYKLIYTTHLSLNYILYSFTVFFYNRVVVMFLPNTFEHLINLYVKLNTIINKTWFVMGVRLRTVVNGGEMV